jgi:Tol biopolymer transport system component
MIMMNRRICILALSILILLLLQACAIAGLPGAASPTSAAPLQGAGDVQKAATAVASAAAAVTQPLAPTVTPAATQTLAPTATATLKPTDTPMPTLTPTLAPTVVGGYPQYYISDEASPDGTQRMILLRNLYQSSDRKTLLTLSGYKRPWAQLIPSPLGDRMLITACDENTPCDLYLMSMDGAVQKKLSMQVNLSILAPPQWFPDGKKLFIAVDNLFEYTVTLLTINLSDESVTKFTTKLIDHRAELSPDGTRIAYIQNSLLYVSNLDGGSVKLAASGTSIQKFHWMPDGKRLLYSDRFDFTKGETLYTVNLDTQERTRLANPIGATYFDWLVSPDGKTVLFQTNKALYAKEESFNHLLWAVPGNGSKEPLKIGYTLNSYRFSPDGSRIYFSGSKLEAGNADIKFDTYSCALDGGDMQIQKIGDYVLASKGIVWLPASK